MLRGTHGVRCSLYVDDMIIMTKSKSKLLESLHVAQDLFESLGFSVNEEKSVLTPSHSITHLGFCINSTRMTISLPREKISPLRKKCKHILKHHMSISIREVASLVGLFIANSQGCKWGKLFYKSLL